MNDFEKRPIPGYENYWASSGGEVTHTSLNPPVPQLQTDGTIHLALYRNGSQTVVPRAELVLAAWGFEPAEGQYIVHLNGNLMADQLSNLDFASEPEPNRLTTPIGVRYGYGTGKVIEQIDTSPSGGNDTGPAFDLTKSLHTKTGRKFK